MPFSSAVQALVVATLFVGVPPAAAASNGSFLRGDTDGSGALDVSDPIATLGDLFLGHEGISCASAADADDNGALEISDALFGFQFLFLGGPAPAAPFPVCGVDPTPDGLRCDGDPRCEAPAQLAMLGGGGSFSDTCAIEDALFRSAEGGCKQLSPRLVWVNLSQGGANATWDVAASECDALTAGGFSDWRLPNVAELQGLSSEDEFHLRILAGDFVYWSSETKGNRAWGVFLGGPSSGATMLPLKISGLFALCVRPGTPPICGDGFCDPGETGCSCATDCGAPPATETACANGADDDCDGLVDCNDSDCAADPSCQGPVCGNGVCEAGESCNTCPGDCPGKSTGPASGRYCCGDGITQAPEASDPTLCDGNN